MPDNPQPENKLGPTGHNNRGRVGDVPDDIGRRYYTDDRGGPGRGYYVDASVVQPAFRDRGRQLTAERADPNAIRDMTAIARHRGWSIVTAQGSRAFRREAWLAGRAAGLEMRGYQPTERDLQELERLRERRAQGEQRLERHQDRRKEGREPAADLEHPGRSPREEHRGAAQMRVVEAVVRAWVQDEDGQRRILDRARTRIADWLERGARFEPAANDRRSSEQRQRVR